MWTGWVCLFFLIFFSFTLLFLSSSFDRAVTDIPPDLDIQGCTWAFSDLDGLINVLLFSFKDHDGMRSPWNTSALRYLGCYHLPLQYRK